MSTRNLRCKLGAHDWVQKGATGRAPANCPEHDPRKAAKASAAPPQRRRRKAAELPAEEGSALARARAFQRTAAELVKELKAERRQLEEQLEEIDAAIAHLGGEENLPPPKPTRSSLTPAPRAAETTATNGAKSPERCPHGVARESCALCPKRQNRISDHDAAARPGA